MRTRLLRRAVLILAAAATVGVVPAAQAQDGTLPFTVNQGGVAGFGFVTIEVCDGTTRAWRARVTSSDGRFRRGPAQALASGLVTGEDPSGQRVTLQVAILSPGQPVTIERREGPGSGAAGGPAGGTPPRGAGG